MVPLASRRTTLPITASASRRRQLGRRGRPAIDRRSTSTSAARRSSSVTMVVVGGDRGGRRGLLDTVPLDRDDALSRRRRSPSTRGAGRGSAAVSKLRTDTVMRSPSNDDLGAERRSVGPSQTDTISSACELLLGSLDRCRRGVVERKGDRHHEHADGGRNERRTTERVRETARWHEPGDHEHDHPGEDDGESGWWCTAARHPTQTLHCRLPARSRSLRAAVRARRPPPHRGATPTRPFERLRRRLRCPRRAPRPGRGCRARYGS